MIKIVKQGGRDLWLNDKKVQVWGELYSLM
jgi:uncharacterized protein YlzI (FlbEa/FlbD family)